MTFVKAYLGDTPLFQESTPAPAVGLPLLKTGQTVSYDTGDDGDIEAGRPTDFFTLSSSNPLGNLNRFTAMDGTQTYADNIVVDWSTYNGATVLAYYRGDLNSPRTLLNALAYAAGLTVSGFTNWRVTNFRELFNIAYYGADPVLGYAPINAENIVPYLCSTTLPGNSNRYYTILSNGASTGELRTFAARHFVCRTFTVTGTILS